MTDPDRKARRQIVSSAHLVSDRAAELSAYEFGLILSFNAFSRWIVRCMAAAGYPNLAYLDVLVLHAVNHPGQSPQTRQGKRLYYHCPRQGGVPELQGNP